MSLLAQDTVLARRVGALAMAVLGLAIVFFVFVFDRIDWGSHIRVRVYFHETGGLAEGAPFVVAGRSIGRVESIAPAPKTDRSGPGAGPIGSMTRGTWDGGVVATVAIDADAARDLAIGDVFVASRGPLSGKYLELGAAEPGAKLLHDGDELIGRDPPSLDRVLQRTWDNLTTFGRFTDELRPELDALRAQLRELQKHLDELAPGVHLRADVSALIDEAGRTYDALGDRPGLDRIAALADDARTTIAQGRATLAALAGKVDALSASLQALRGRLDHKGQQIVDQAELAIERVRATIDKLEPLLAQVDALTTSLARGEGSMMKLMHDPEFPEDAKELGKILKRHPWRVIDHAKGN